MKLPGTSKNQVTWSKWLIMQLVLSFWIPVLTSKCRTSSRCSQQWLQLEAPVWILLKCCYIHIRRYSWSTAVPRLWNSGVFLFPVNQKNDHLEPGLGPLDSQRSIPALGSQWAFVCKCVSTEYVNCNCAHSSGFQPKLTEILLLFIS